MFSRLAAAFSRPTTTGQATPHRHLTTVPVNVTSTQSEGDITMQIIDHGQNDPLDFELGEGWAAVAKHARPNLPGANRADETATVFRAIKTLERHAAWRKTELSPDDEITRAMDVVIRFARDHQVVPA